MKECFAVFRKELLEIFRDTSTFLIFLIPILIFPALNIGIHYINQSSKSQMTLCVHYNNQQAYETLLNFISENDNYIITMTDSENPKELLQSGDINCFIDIENMRFNFVYSSLSYNSLFSSARLGEDFQKFYSASLSQSQEDIYQFCMKDENGNVTTTTDSMFNIVVPIVLIMLIFQGTSSFANDIFAGERERKTLELLLLSGAKRSAIYCGKSLALLAIGIINLAIGLGSYCASFCFDDSGLRQFGFMKNGDIGKNVTYMVMALFMLTVISVVTSITISMKSKNMKNAQILNEMVVIIPVGMITLLKLGAIRYARIAFARYIPFVNLIVGFNNAFGGCVPAFDIIVSLITNIVLALAIVVMSTRYMYTEKILK